MKFDFVAEKFGSAQLRHLRIMAPYMPFKEMRTIRLWKSVCEQPLASVIRHFWIT